MVSGLYQITRARVEFRDRFFRDSRTIASDSVVKNYSAETLFPSTLSMLKNRVSDPPGIGVLGLTAEVGGVARSTHGLTAVVTLCKSSLTCDHGA
jgi:hypothetical protein